MSGKGVAQDTAEAMTWYRKAAEHGNADAENNLGAIYAEGRGVPRDYVRAYAWFSLAMLAGDQRAQGNRDIAARNMTPAEIAEAEQLAQRVKPRK
jgi:TPR repeat protein